MFQTQLNSSFSSTLSQIVYMEVASPSCKDIATPRLSKNHQRAFEGHSRAAQDSDGSRVISVNGTN